jgi:hypothetical protein
VLADAKEEEARKATEAQEAEAAAKQAESEAAYQRQRADAICAGKPVPVPVPAAAPVPDAAKPGPPAAPSGPAKPPPKPDDFDDGLPPPPRPKPPEPKPEAPKPDEPKPPEPKPEEPKPKPTEDETKKKLIDKLGGVNPTKSGTNCAACAAATDKTLAGDPTAAPDVPGKSFADVKRDYEQRYGTQMIEVGSKDDVDKILRDAGPGARLIVVVRNDAGNGHAFNGVNQDGHILYPDGQSGTLQEDWAHFKHTHVAVIRTNSWSTEPKPRRSRRSTSDSGFPSSTS